MLVGKPPPPAPHIDPIDKKIFPGKNLLITGTHLKTAPGLPLLHIEKLDPEPGAGDDAGNTDRLLVPDFSTLTDAAAVFPMPTDVPFGNYKVTFLKGDLLSNSVQVEVVPYHWRISFLDLSWKVWGLGTYADSGLYQTGAFPGLVAPLGSQVSSNELSWCKWNIFAIYTLIVDKEGFTVVTSSRRTAFRPPSPAKASWSAIPASR